MPMGVAFFVSFFTISMVLPWRCPGLWMYEDVECVEGVEGVEGVAGVARLAWARQARMGRCEDG